MSDLELKLRGGVYQVSGTVKIPGRKRGVRVRESTGTGRLRDAETYRDKLRQEVVEREIHGPGHTLTVAGCIIIYLEKGGEKRFIGPILEKFGTTRISELSADKISQFAIERYGHMAPASVKRFFYTPLNAAIRKGCKEHRISPISFEPPRVEKAVVIAAPAGWFPDFFQAAHFRIAVMVLFLTTTGARVSEACRLAIEDCMFDHPKGPRALLQRTKNGKPRMVPLTPVLASAMQKLIQADEATKPTDRVFGYSSRWSVNQAIERVCRNANLKYYSSHKLGRHAFAARLLDDGKTLHHVKDAGGWSSIQIVDEAYGHLENNGTDASILDMGSQVAEHMTGTLLTHSTYQQRRRHKDGDEKTKAKSGALVVVGTTGIEPVTPTMSREVSEVGLDDKTPENKGD
jgi:integrase